MQRPTQYPFPLEAFFDLPRLQAAGAVVLSDAELAKLPVTHCDRYFEQVLGTTYEQDTLWLDRLPEPLRSIEPFGSQRVVEEGGRCMPAAEVRRQVGLNSNRAAALLYMRRQARPLSLSLFLFRSARTAFFSWESMGGRNMQADGAFLVRSIRQGKMVNTRDWRGWLRGEPAVWTRQADRLKPERPLFSPSGEYLKVRGGVVSSCCRLRWRPRTARTSKLI